MNVRDVAHAEELVVRDRRAGDPMLTYAEALRDAVETVDLARVEGDDEVAEAYRVVLAYRTPPSREQLLRLVRALAVEGLAGLSTEQRVWLLRAERAELY